MKATISILICTRNRAPYLARTLENMAKTEIPHDFMVELIVMDNASTDETADVVRRCGIRNMAVRYMAEPRPGKALACNEAIKAATGSIIFFSDDDVLVPRKWIGPMCEPILKGRAEAVSGAVKIPPHLTRPWMTEYHRGWLGSSEGFSEKTIENLLGGNMACAREVFALVPGLDPELGPGGLGYHEESLFTWQLKLAGFRVAFLPNVVVEHHFPEFRLTRQLMLDTAFRAGRSSAYVAHHWEHRQIRNPRLHWLRALMRLTYWRLRRFGLHPPRDHSPRWEMEMLMDVCYFRQYLREKRRPRNYKPLALRRSS